MTVEDTFQIQVPGSTSNLGAGFDCFGLALQLYLRVEVSPLAAGSTPVIEVTGDEGNTIPTTPDNLIWETAVATAASMGQTLNAVRLSITNDIPLGRGLGSSAAAIVAGVAMGAKLCGVELPREDLVSRAAAIEGHADNVAASVGGGRVICHQDSSGAFRAMTLPWPAHIRIVVVSPDVLLATKEARAVLPASVPRETAVFNLQRTAMLTAALDQGTDDMIWEATRDRLHQSFRENLVPGLAAALSLPRQKGLLGIALSGAGPSVVALVSDRDEEIGQAVASAFEKAGIGSTIRLLEVDHDGARIAEQA